MVLYKYRDHAGGIQHIVGPAIRKRAQMRSAPIHHVLLKTERPPFVSILSVVRDAVARLPDGVGTRMDVTELSKDSQWLAMGTMDENLMSMTIGGGLDRL